MGAFGYNNVDVVNVLGSVQMRSEIDLVNDLTENEIRLISEIEKLFPNSDINEHLETPQGNEIACKFIHDYQQVIQCQKSKHDLLRKGIEEHFSILDDALRFSRSFRAEEDLDQVRRKWQAFRRIVQAFDADLDQEESILY